MKSRMTELIMQKVTVNNMDVMFALCTSPSPVPGIPHQFMMDGFVNWTGITKQKKLTDRDKRSSMYLLYIQVCQV